MNRALLATLFLSLAANALFLGRAVRRTSPPAASASPVSPDAFSTGHEPPPAPVFPPASWAALQSASPGSLTFLRQLGFTDPEIRTIIRAEIDTRYSAREQALRKTPGYWEHSFFPQRPGVRETVIDHAANRALALQKENELRQILDDIYEPAHTQLRQFASYLPFEKAWQLVLILDDYRLMEEANARGTFLRLPRSIDQIHYLRDQQRTDIESLLTPGELSVHDIHTSNTASSLRSLPGFNPSKEEFIAFYELYKSLNARGISPAMSPAHRELIDQEIRSLLDEKRYADYQRAKDPDFHASYRIASDLGLPQETAIAGYEHLKSLRAQLTAFTAQNTVTHEQAEIFHAQMRQKTETTLTRLYGEKGASAARDLINSRLSEHLRTIAHP